MFVSTLKGMAKLTTYLFAQVKQDLTVISIMLLLLQMSFHFLLEWKVVDLPFNEFKHRFSNSVLDGNDIQTFGIVAYGREIFKILF